MRTALGPARYGKAGIRLATVRRAGATHHFQDLTIDVRLDGDYDASYADGDNSMVLPTDSMRGACYALARERGVEGPERFALLLAEHFLATSPAAATAEIEVAAHRWERLEVSGSPHPHAFRPAAGGDRTALVRRRRDGEAVVLAGIDGLRLLKTTGSGFEDFLKDRYTTLPETDDRIMATTVVATWRYREAGVDFDRLAAAVPPVLSAAFAEHDDSRSVQHTLARMGEAALAAFPEIAWIRFRMPNEHHVLADLEPYGLDNPGEVFVVTDRPYGVIEGTVARDGVGAEPLA